MRYRAIKALTTWLLLLQTTAAPAQPGAEPGAETEISTQAAQLQLTLDELRTFTDVFNQVRRNYVEPVDDRTLLESAISGMLAELDPHSAYLPTRDFQDLEDSSAGRYVGLGFDVRPVEGRLVVRHVIDPSPAHTAGIEAGDLITSVDDRPVRGRLLQESIDAINGPEGSMVRLVVTRPGGESRALELRRAYVKLPALDYRLLEGRFGYFRIVYFHRESAGDLEASIRSVLANETVLDGLILDLRGNPGGVLQPAVDMADGFLESGIIVTTRGRNAALEAEYSAMPGEWLPGAPVVVLVDRGTASASEVLAGALQDHGRAVIIGERTFGKGSVQSVLSLRNGAGLKLTTARYYTPSGRSIQAEGIEPDIPVASEMRAVTTRDDRRREADLARHLNGESGSGAGRPARTLDPEDDFPLFQAISVLRGAQVLSRAGVPQRPAQ